MIDLTYKALKRKFAYPKGSFNHHCATVDIHPDTPTADTVDAHITLRIPGAGNPFVLDPSLL
jgi:polyisoprenoid-binding protein YceI